MRDSQKTFGSVFFRLSQGGSDAKDVLIQGNQSFMLLHKHYPFSIGRGSKHINVRHFFVGDKIHKKEVRIVCCPTDKMIADRTTKPTQGTAFKVHRNTIMGTSEEKYDVHKGWCKEVLCV